MVMDKATLCCGTVKEQKTKDEEGSVGQEDQRGYASAWEFCRLFLVNVELFYRAVNLLLQKLEMSQVEEQLKEVVTDGQPQEQ